MILVSILKGFQVDYVRPSDVARKYFGHSIVSKK